MPRKLPVLTLIVLGLAALAGCDSPSPSMAGSRNATIDVGGMTFGVHWTESRAEIYRTSWAKRTQWADVPVNAEIAVRQATGCEVKAMDGDPSLMVATLDCSLR